MGNGKKVAAGAGAAALIGLWAADVPSWVQGLAVAAYAGLIALQMVLSARKNK